MINRDVWIEAGRLSSQGAGFCLVTIERSQGSAPRRAGSAMLVRSDGSTVGTIGGGTIERTAVEDALASLAEGRTWSREFDLYDPSGETTGSLCGGKIQVLYAPQAAVMNLHIFGSGHVARPVCTMATQLGYAVHVYDATDEWATGGNFPHATSLHCADLVELATQIEFRDKDAVIILTGSHTDDFTILQTFKDRIPPYLGVIASKKKADIFRRELSKLGWPADQIASIHSPMGLEIHSRTPAEIALSILAEIVQLRGPIE